MNKNKDIKENKDKIILYLIFSFLILIMIFGFESGDYKAVLSSPVYLTYIKGLIFICMIGVIPHFIKIISLKKGNS
jgi:hypothetical protein